MSQSQQEAAHNLECTHRTAHFSAAAIIMASTVHELWWLWDSKPFVVRKASSDSIHFCFDLGFYFSIQKLPIQASIQALPECDFFLKLICQGQMWCISFRLREITLNWCCWKYRMNADTPYLHDIWPLNIHLPRYDVSLHTNACLSLENELYFLA